MQDFSAQTLCFGALVHFLHLINGDTRENVNEHDGHYENETPVNEIVDEIVALYHANAHLVCGHLTNRKNHHLKNVKLKRRIELAHLSALVSHSAHLIVGGSISKRQNEPYHHYEQNYGQRKRFHQYFAYHGDVRT